MILYWVSQRFLSMVPGHSDGDTPKGEFIVVHRCASWFTIRFSVQPTFRVSSSTR